MWGWWLETLSRPLWRHWNAIIPLLSADWTSCCTNLWVAVDLRRITLMWNHLMRIRCQSSSFGARDGFGGATCNTVIIKIEYKYISAFSIKLQRVYRVIYLMVIWLMNGIIIITSVHAAFDYRSLITECRKMRYDVIITNWCLVFQMTL